MISPATGQPTRVGLTPLRADGQVEYGPRRDYLLQQNVNQVQQVLRTEAATGPFDLLALISAAVRATSHPGTLLVLSSGLSTAGGLDLRAVGWGANPAAVAGQLKNGACCRGWRAGGWISRGWPPWPATSLPLPLPQRTTLTAYWMAICQRRRALPAVPLTTRSGLIRASRRPDTGPGGARIPSVVSVTGPRRLDRGQRPGRGALRFQQRAAAPWRGQPSCGPLVGPGARAAASWSRSPGTPHRTAAPPLTTRPCRWPGRGRSVDRLEALPGLPPGQIARVDGAGHGRGRRLRLLPRHGQLDEAVCATLRRVVILLTPATKRPHPDRRLNLEVRQWAFASSDSQPHGQRRATTSFARPGIWRPAGTELPEDPFTGEPLAGGLAGEPLARPAGRGPVRGRARCISPGGGPGRGCAAASARCCHAAACRTAARSPPGAEDDHISESRDLARVTTAKPQSRRWRRQAPTPSWPGTSATWSGKPGARTRCGPGWLSCTTQGPATGSGSGSATPTEEAPGRRGSAVTRRPPRAGRSRRRPRPRAHASITGCPGGSGASRSARAGGRPVSLLLYFFAGITDVNWASPLVGRLGVRGAARVHGDRAVLRVPGVRRAPAARLTRITRARSAFVELDVAD